MNCVRRILGQAALIAMPQNDALIVSSAAKTKKSETACAIQQKLQLTTYYSCSQNAHFRAIKHIFRRFNIAPW